jgi:Kef-type K+ transport system membrane component KefB
VAELDDVSGVALMAPPFGIAPVLRSGGAADVAGVLASTGLAVLAKLLVFGAFCFLFSHYVEKHITHMSKALKPTPDPMLLVVGVGLVIAAAAGILGFSVAIGAFFAGLVFSRDPDAVKMESSFVALYELFVPFFFIQIGLSIDLGGLGTALGLGAALVALALVDKTLGTGLPAWLSTDRRTAMLFGISMIPRAEITMIVMEHGHDLGDWAVPGRLFSAMVLVSAVTCVFVPLVLHRLLLRWVSREE